MNDRHVRLDGPSDLLAAVPHLVGFYPVDSVIVLTFHDIHARPRLAAAMRLDVPRPAVYDRFLATVQPPLLADPDVDGVIAVVTTAAGDLAAEGLPHHGLVSRLATLCSEIGVPLLQAFWTPEFRAGAPWGSYADPLVTGTVADPSASALGVVAALAGEVTYSSLPEMTELLAPQLDEASAARWRTALDTLTDQTTTATTGEYDNAAHRLVLETIHALAEGGEVCEDILIRVLHAISDQRIRDAVFRTALGPHARAAEGLWITLMRCAPTGPEVVEAAVLLTFSAYMRGHGTLAALALERALHIDPDHSFARLLNQALSYGIPPDKLAPIADAEPNPTSVRGSDR
ncbi:DUF4192 domain-containing protein [Saccharopolyspora mangrovi]|uniref:DUF4192 domain-containing protein n=1 Tax=Saccharopolyspora mangrovi TaxID=3082379 RepID=A0ABU6ALK8_9PSEU|nr:DUF4192 domain-containing protein [Saccharopolyspora sp. S2-29]MEB3372439.1 DUF4192 domain-containing protein [Saccharopolyspora sp. S2-29]